MSRFDPRWKLAALAVAMLVAVLVQTAPAAAAGLAGALVLAGWGRLPWRWYLGRVGPATLALALFLAPLPFLLPGEGPSWGPLHVSVRGAHAAWVLGCKALTVLTLTLVLVATGPLESTLQAAAALRVPGLLVQLLLLSYRYLHLLTEEFDRLRVALLVRGYRNRATRHCYRTVAHVAGTLLVRGFERAERVGRAMRCRGFDGQFRSLTTFRTRRADVGAFALIVAGSLAVWGLDWVPR